ncbi:MAG: gamma-glutamyl-gamma-aminobutyrate hydrolase family protein [Gemmatimonadetes bacterium]|nr:gamma-glutamyl-gamma-aminobutyrate hydrolase family protein [Gemmatimonadota bacterium]
MPPPLVALTASSKAAAGPGKYSRVRVNEAYVRALQSVGLVPLVIPPSLSPDEASAVVARVSGVVLSGGEDVDPARYGAARHPATQKPKVARDATELALVEAARAAQRPMLGICRGLQLLNVALGGTLVQDLGMLRPSEIGHSLETSRAHRVHGVTILSGSRLAAAAGDLVIEVNSFHHQGVDQLAPSLRATAYAPDGVVEAVETTDDWWALAVQWHPEELLQDAKPWDRAIFQAFAQACEQRRRG